MPTYRALPTACKGTKTLYFRNIKKIIIKIIKIKVVSVEPDTQQDKGLESSHKLTRSYLEIRTERR